MDFHPFSHKIINFKSRDLRNYGASGRTVAKFQRKSHESSLIH